MGLSESSSFRFAILHRRELRRGRRQPSGAGVHGEAHQVHSHRKSPSLWCRSRDHQGPGEFRRRNRRRRRQRWHSESSRRSQLGDSVDQLERVALLPFQQHHSHHRRQWDHDLRRRGPHLAASPGDEKCPKCPQLDLTRWQGEGVHGAFHGRVDSFGSSIFRVVQPGDSGHAKTVAGVSEG